MRRADHRTEPLDTAAVTADDRALDALGADDAVSWDLDDPAFQVLAALRDDVSIELSEPSTSWPAAVDLRPGARRRHMGKRLLVGGVVTAAVLSASGVAAASITTGPGATLYPIHQLLTGAKPTHSEHAAAQVRHFLKLADKDLDHNRLTPAGEELDHAATWLTRVDANDQGDLPQQLAAMRSRYAAAVAAATGTHGASGTDNQGTGTQHGGERGQGPGRGSSDHSNDSTANSGDHSNSGSHNSHAGSDPSGPGDAHGTSGDHGDSSGSGQGSASGSQSGDSGSDGSSSVDGGSSDGSGSLDIGGRTESHGGSATDR